MKKEISPSHDYDQSGQSQTESPGTILPEQNGHTNYAGEPQDALVEAESRHSVPAQELSAANGHNGHHAPDEIGSVPFRRSIPPSIDAAIGQSSSKLAIPQREREPSADGSVTNATTAAAAKPRPRSVKPAKDPTPRYGTVQEKIRMDQEHVGESEKDVEDELTAQDIDSPKLTLLDSLRNLVLGDPIASQDLVHQRIDKFRALAILSSDALSSVAYGTEASLAVLATAGIADLTNNLIIGACVVLLLTVVAFSYNQTIHAYPNGGGSYIVAKENLSPLSGPPLAGLVAAAALLIDYILTVSVSISAGVDALNSAFPNITSWSVGLGIILIGIMVVVNIRGVRDTGTFFVIPTYFFVISFILLIVVGMGKAIVEGGLLHNLPAVANTKLYPHATPILQTSGLSFILLLTAFASGCSAMTGTEAISNGVPIFKQPQSRNAAQTLTMMAVLLGIMYAGTTYLTWRFGLVPYENSNPTITSQLADYIFSGSTVGHLFYYLFQFGTTLILILAANTSFADFPRLASILARDDYMPHIFQNMGDRLAFNTGIIVLGGLSAFLLAIFHGNTEALINLYALGVFCAFTLSQSGMVVHWLRAKKKGDPSWRSHLVFNALGALATGIVTIIIAITKFDRGAWVVVFLIPILTFLFLRIHAHYSQVKEVTARAYDGKKEENLIAEDHRERHVIIVPIARWDRLAIDSLRYARSLSPHVIALHIGVDAERAREIREKWEAERLETVKKTKLAYHQDIDIFADETDQSASAPVATTKSDVTTTLHAGGQYSDSQSQKDAALVRNQKRNEQIEKVQTMLEHLNDVHLVIIQSPLRQLVRPLLNFIRIVTAAERSHAYVTIILPEYITNNPFEWILHNQTALQLKLRLMTMTDVVTVNMPQRLLEPKTRGDERVIPHPVAHDEHAVG